ncbi:Alpha/Beta hydrolase protein [Mycena sp. CBHHK59/15]|nr:Alpha/Beta hydrolase protein [Mycena sp. CBHHK59/15]
MPFPRSRATRSPPHPSWTANIVRGLADIARRVNAFMVQLGFAGGYVVQGGDIGSQVARILKMMLTRRTGVHLNFCYMVPPDVPASALSDRDRAGVARSSRFVSYESVYSFEQATRPATLGFAIASSPLALLAWIGEKFMDWTDEVPPMSTILEAVSLYWYTDTIARSFHPYRDTTWRITKPFGFSSFPKEILPSPRAWIETTGVLVFYWEHAKGGDFAAIESPEALWGDVEAFVAQV